MLSCSFLSHLELTRSLVCFRSLQCVVGLRQRIQPLPIDDVPSDSSLYMLPRMLPRYIGTHFQARRLVSESIAISIIGHSRLPVPQDVDTALRR